MKIMIPEYAYYHEVYTLGRKEIYNRIVKRKISEVEPDLLEQLKSS